MSDITMIPGPIEFDSKVLTAMSHKSMAHNSPKFIEVFGSVLTDLRELFQSKDKNAQPFVIAGGGTLGWEIAAANLGSPDSKVLTISTGYFSDAFADCMRIFCGDVKVLSAPPGSTPTLEAIEEELKKTKYSIITLTHVDTSTSVLIDIKAISELVHRISPNTFIVVDGVCSIGVEPLYFDDWKLDFVLTAPQKAIGAPAGLSLTFVSSRALEHIKSQPKIPIYYGNLQKWLPIMQAYESRKPSYFSTPAIQNIYALQETLKQILHKGSSIVERFDAHKKTSDKLKQQISSWNLKILTEPHLGAHGLTCVFLPENIKLSDFLPRVAAKGVTIAGGLYKGINTSYFRIGHMGISSIDPSRGDIDRTLDAIKQSLNEIGYKC